MDEIWSLLLLHLHHLQIKMYCDSMVSCTVPTSAVLVSASAVLVSLLLCNISSLSAAVLCRKLQFSVCVLIVDNPALFALLMQLFRFAVSVSFSVVVLVTVLRSVVVCGFYRSLSFCSLLSPLVFYRSVAIDSLYLSLSPSLLSLSSLL